MPLFLNQPSSSSWLLPASLNHSRSTSTARDRALLARAASLRVHLTTLHSMETVHLERIATQKSEKVVRHRQIRLSTSTTARPTSTTDAQMEQTARPTFSGREM